MGKKISMAKRKDFLLRPEAYGLDSKVRLAEEIAAELRKKPWHLRFDCSLKSMPANDVDAFHLLKAFFEKVSMSLRAKNLCTGLRFTGVYVPERTVLGELNPHFHGLVIFFKRGDRPLEDFASDLVFAADQESILKPGCAVARRLSRDEDVASYITGEIASEWFPIVRGRSVGINV